jgi:hypothetical protein
VSKKPPLPETLEKGRVLMHKLHKEAVEAKACLWQAQERYDKVHREYTVVRSAFRAALSQHQSLQSVKGGE